MLQAHLPQGTDTAAWWESKWQSSNELKYSLFQTSCFQMVWVILRSISQVSHSSREPEKEEEAASEDTSNEEEDGDPKDCFFKKQD